MTFCQKAAHIPASVREAAAAAEAVLEKLENYLPLWLRGVDTSPGPRDTGAQSISTGGMTAERRGPNWMLSQNDYWKTESSTHSTICTLGDENHSAAASSHHPPNNYLRWNTKRIPPEPEMQLQS